MWVLVLKHCHLHFLPEFGKYENEIWKWKHGNSFCRNLLLTTEGAIIPIVNCAYIQRLYLLSSDGCKYDKQKGFGIYCVVSWSGCFLPTGAPVLGFFAGELSTLPLFSEKEAVLLDAGV